VSPARGKFITFEGLDGTGKSTQIAKLARALRARGCSVVVTREPGGTATGEKIRHVILDSATTSLDSMAEMALMFASRAQHIAEIIEPALAAGKIVLCDRFTDSTEAYQGGGRKLGSKPVLALHRILCRDLQPDLTILLDFDLATSIARARRRNLAQTRRNASVRPAQTHKDENRFEQENRAFFGRVRQAYQTIARRESARMVQIDASGTPSQTHTKVLETVRKKLRLA
jgi:dTMP kinase